MSLVWHIICKDFRRLQWPLALWLILWLGQTILLVGVNDWADISPADFAGWRNFATTWSLIAYTVGFILAAWLVMEDSLVTTQAFWRTRPISGGRLLAAKLGGGVLMLSLLPALVLTPVWMGYGFSVREIGLAACNLVVVQAILSAVAIALACVTETSGQFLIRMIGVVILVPLSSSYLQGAFLLPEVEVSHGLWQSRYWLALGLFAVALAVLVVHQYLTRRKARSCVLLTLGVLLMLGVRLGWTWDYATWLEERDLVNGSAARTTIGIKGGVSWYDLNEINLNASKADVSGGTYVRLDPVWGRWAHADEQLPPIRFTPRPGTGRPLEDSVRQVVGLPPEGADDSGIVLASRLPVETLEQVRQQEMKLKLFGRAILMKGRVLGRLPLRKGAEFQSGASRLRISALDRTDEGQVIVRLEERDAWSGAQMNGLLHPLLEFRLPEDSYMLLNPAVGEELFLGSGEAGAMSINSIKVGQRAFTVTPPQHEVNGRKVEVRGWEETAVLVRVRFAPDDNLSTSFAVDLTPRAPGINTDTPNRTP